MHRGKEPEKLPDVVVAVGLGGWSGGDGNLCCELLEKRVSSLD
jgi:hypothetical protein